MTAVDISIAIGETDVVFVRTTRNTNAVFLLNEHDSLTIWQRHIQTIYVLYDMLIEKMGLRQTYRMGVSLSKNRAPPCRGRDYHTTICRVGR